MVAPTIPTLRESIDALDRQILGLLVERLRLVIQVGEIKRAGNLEVYDAEREREMLERLALAASAPLEPEIAQRIFQCIIQESRKLEQRHISSAE